MPFSRSPLATFFSCLDQVWMANQEEVSASADKMLAAGISTELNEFSDMDKAPLS
jgi:hypothetical protein